MVGPWIRTRGSDTGVLVSFLGEEELVIMDVETNGSFQDSVSLNHDGEYPLPKCERVRFRKVNSSACLPTSVHLVAT